MRMLLSTRRIRDNRFTNTKPNADSNTQSNAFTLNTADQITHTETNKTPNALSFDVADAISNREMVIRTATVTSQCWRKKKKAKELQTCVSQWNTM